MSNRSNNMNVVQLDLLKQKSKANSHAQELSGIFVCGRELTVGEWERMIWSEVRSHITRLSKAEVLDLLAVYHPGKVRNTLGHSPKEIRHSPAVPLAVRNRLRLIRDSGDSTSSVYAKTGEDLAGFRQPKFSARFERGPKIARKIGGSVPVLWKLVFVFTPIVLLFLALTEAIA